MSDIINIKASYNIFDLLLTLSENLSGKAFESGDSRRAFYHFIKDVSEKIEEAQLTQEIRDFRMKTDEHNNNITPENRNSDEVKLNIRNLSTENDLITQKRATTELESSCSRFCWEKGLKYAYGKEADGIFRQAKVLAQLDDFIAQTEAANL